MGDLYEYDGILLETACGNLTDDEADCCVPPPSCDECPATSATFTGTLSARTDDATQIPDTVAATWNGSLWFCGYDEIGGDWGTCSSGDPKTVDVSFECVQDSPDPGGNWLVYIAATWGTTATLVSATCTDGKWTIVVDYELAGGDCGTGTFTITWVQD